MTTLLFNKPYGVLCQFTDERREGPPRPTLADYIKVPGVYAAGRLDQDSEGLMVLTDDGRLQARLTAPRAGREKTYWVHVEGVPDDHALVALRTGIVLKDGLTAPAKARRIPQPETLWPRDPPIRVRKSVADSWLEITLTEGRNRQVRRMTAAAGYPTLRLIRCRIGPWSLDGLQPGDSRAIEPGRI